MSTPDMEWMGDGACVGQPLDLFFPDKDNTAQQREAKAWCALCPVVLECLTFALRHGQAGVWGNTTDAERKRIRRTERLPVVQPLGDPIEHGTAAGAHAVTVRPEFAAGLATDPLTLAAMAQFDQHSEASTL